MSDKTTIIGGVPQPSGGVTGYIYRLCHHLSDEVVCVVDLYPHAEKWSIGNVKLVARSHGSISFFRWFFNAVVALIFARKIYFNFSGTKFLALASLMPKMPWQTWVLTLHHGELQSSSALSKLELWGLRRMNKIGYIGNKQRSFYLDNDYYEEKLFPIVPFLPFVSPPMNAKSYDETLLSSLQEIRKKYDRILLASGYPSTIYNHEWAIEYINSQAHNEGVGFILCLYGSDPEDKWDTLRIAAEKNPNIYLFEYLQPDAFQEVLKIIDIYLRPNSVDSYGVAVGEAISLGKIAIASNACDRFDGAKTFPVGDKKAFYGLINEALQNNQEPNIKSHNSSIEMSRDLLA